MEARFVTCRSFQQIKPPEKSLAPPPTVKGLLSRFGSQAQALFAPKKQKFGSSVAIHKLRETKWFKHDEQNILCAVLESGFVLEVRAEDPLPPDSVVSPDYHMYAIAMWKKGKEKTKNPEQIEVYTVQQKGVRKRIIKTTLSNFWKKDSVIRINNVDDKQETPNSEKDIRAKLDMATKSRFERNWHNTLHFVHWCRYGETPQEARMRQISLTTWRHFIDKRVTEMGQHRHEYGRDASQPEQRASKSKVRLINAGRQRRHLLRLLLATLGRGNRLCLNLTFYIQT
ncbi:unnamed protein product [Pieris brassicae]|uniref:Uncharacterized protein n=1 Tax=Pieris brassicae TaxID=7116 RepID=A0A9P0THL1_PIEBR|nr:unnamed protein product [Pieris brassicae]